MAVSYTHLDVYKRQLSHGTYFPALFPVIFPEGAAVQGKWYKRQNPHIPEMPLPFPSLFISSFHHFFIFLSLWLIFFCLVLKDEVEVWMTLTSILMIIQRY